MIKITNNKIIKKINHFLADFFEDHPTWFLSLLSFLLICYLFTLFGLYALKSPDSQEIPKSNTVKTGLYKTVLEKLKNRDIKIQQAKDISYPDIFR